MTRSRLIVPLCFLLSAGCSLFDSSEMATDPAPAPAPVTEVIPAPVTAVVEEVPVVMPPPAPRNFTRDDVRVLQLRLREVGFDPGPVDGVAGIKTRAAFARFQVGCSSAAAVIEQWSGPGAQSSNMSSGAAPMPDRRETQTLQTQLHSAGFNPGPIDGIFGHKTRSLLAQLKHSCPLAPDFAQMLDHPSLRIGHSASDGPKRNTSKSPEASAQTGGDRARQPPRSQEEIRVLQLQLRDAGFDPGPFDGIMGPKTQSALQHYQASRKGKPTTLVSGIVEQY